MSGLVWKFATCNVKGINVPVKQMNIVCWHVNFKCMVSFVMETKLWSNFKPWIANKFENIHVFTSGLDKEFFGAGVAVIINNFLARYVFKVEEIFGQVILVWLLFKGKLSVIILRLYAEILIRMGLEGV
ncbi:hypothetical protein G9A89_007991 [Geosiphon pyriformis]|nr:hypothetical protein G9A89_007991 [Geosiphon pyriformis]